MSFIILDRDGVINYDSAEYIKSPEEWQAIPGSLEAIAQLNRHGFRVLVVTNQSGIGRGFYDIETLDNIHEKFLRELAAVGGYVDEIFFCPHHPNDGCTCRKPKPGLFYKLQEKYPVNFAETFFIGDSLGDVQVAKVVGCEPLFVLSGKGDEALSAYPEFASVLRFPHLTSAVDYVISKQRK